jgi:photosystem II stability/assembly factor-like uncharacterized protein
MGTILKTTNAGLNWITQQSCFSIGQNAIFFVDPLIGYLVGQEGIGKTTNGGQNWFVVFNPNKHVFTAFFLNKDTGYAGGKYQFFARTTNGGLNWTDMNSQTTDYLFSIYFTNSLTGYAVGGTFEYGTIIKTTNGGARWIRQNIGEPVCLYSVYFLNSFTGYTAGAYIDSNHTNPAIVLKTTNGGTNWVTQLIGQGYYVLFTLYFNNALTGYAGGITRILKTTNGGINWYSQLSTYYHYLYSICFTDINTGYAVTGESLIFKTTNGGEPIGIKPISTNIPGSFQLYQNYPNPFNPSTKIKFDIGPPLSPLLGKEGTGVVLKLFDILGREIATLVNENLNPETYEIIYDGSGLSSGIYFYKLQAGNFVETKKMLMLK